MDDFEYSVHISERDWNCFFQECEECDLLPPALAGVDDSGMYDIDDVGSAFLDRGPQADLQSGFLEADHPIDGPPDCDGSPVENYLSKYGICGSENILSGSEDDVHLESVNRFFERLKSLTEAEQLIEPRQAAVGKNREAVQGEVCSDGQQANNSTMSVNIPKLNTLPASSETAAGKETTEQDNANTNTNAKDGPGSKMATELSANDHDGETDNSTNPKIELVIREEDWSVLPGDETRKQEKGDQSNDLPSMTELKACSVKAAASEKVQSSELAVCTGVGDGKHGDILVNQPVLQKSSDSWHNSDLKSPIHLEIMSYNNLEEGKYISITSPEQQSATKGVSQELSPSSTIKRKRKRKKRVLSIEPLESGNGYKRLFSPNQSDSEEERYTQGTEMNPHTRLSGDHSAANIMEAGYEYIKSSAQPTAVENEVVNISVPFPAARDCQSQELTDTFELTEMPVLAHHLVTECILPANTKGPDRSNQISPPGQVGLLTLNYGGNLTTNLEPSSILPLQASTEFKESLGLPVSITTCASSESALVTEIGKSGRDNFQKSERQVEFLQKQEIHSENENMQASSEVVSPTGSTEHNTSHDSNTLLIPETINGVIITDTQEVHAHEKIHQGFNNGLSSTINEIPSEVVITEAIINPTKTSLPDKNNDFSEPSCSESDKVINATKCGDHTVEPLSEAEPSVLSENSISIERPVSSEPVVTNVIPESGINSHESNEIIVTHMNYHVAERDPDLSSPEDVPITESNIPLNGLSNSPAFVQSNKASMTVHRCTSVTYNTDLDMSAKSTSASDIQNSFSQEEKLSPIKITGEREREITEHEIQDISEDIPELRADPEVETDDSSTRTKTAESDRVKKTSEVKQSVYAISTFWNRMEKLTINDILRLRMVSNAQQSSVLSQPPDSETADTSDATDSGYFTHLDDSKPDHSSGDMSTISDFDMEFLQIQGTDTNPSSDHIIGDESLNSRGDLWESEPDPVSLGAVIYPENVAMSCPVSDYPQPLIPGSVQRYWRKMCKNISVQNLQSLESEPLNQVLKSQALPTVISEEEEPDMELFSDIHVLRRDSGLDSLPPASFSEDVSTESYGISLSGFFDYLFGKRSEPNPSSDTNNKATYYFNGNSVPEMYDHFYSEFDAGNFFYSLPEASGHSKDTLVPIFSCSRSANKCLQFPEAYDHFFPSSSSDDSDEEYNEDCGPIRVVTRFNHMPTETKGAPAALDMYENFFPDGDLIGNFFWKNTFSLRRVHLTSSTSHSQWSDSWSLVPADQSRKSFPTAIQPINILDNQEAPFPDPLPYNLEERIFRQLAAQPMRYEDLQTAIADPNASLVPLKQTDMCLVCIAFASWVLKSANPQAGDAWKAVLLANISALSAIRYLRRYVREEAAGEKPLRQTPPI